MAGIRLTKLTKTYVKDDERIDVLGGIDLDIPGGSFVMVLGESGSGKTTLLNLLGALDTADAGSIDVDDVGDVCRLGDRALSDYRNAVVGHIFQTFNLKGIYTAFENVRIPLIFTPIGPAEARRRITAALEAVGLADRMFFRPGQLSEGQCQRVAVARAIVNEPKVLLADEPTGNLDPKTARHIMDLLMRLNKARGITLIMVTHDMTLLDYADRVVTLDRGHVRENSPEEIDAIRRSLSALRSAGVHSAGGR
ncbi:MAG: ABC transporter ATP-binding protein [Verrucomicrobia bacterium]|nr:ABC transporter ATP-binding protein [Verrucomicrobiota bacterium]